MGIGVARRAEDDLLRPLFDRPAQIHHHQLVGDVLHGAEVGLPRHAAVHVDRDVAGLALVGGAEQRVVGRHEADLDREADAQAAALELLEQISDDDPGAP